MKRSFSCEQKAYMAAKALHSVAYDRAREYDKLMDAEGDRLGIPTPFAILPEGHPMWAEVQKLLDQENAAKKLMYEAAFNLFDWATSAAFAKVGTPAQHQSIRKAVEIVKQQAYVEPAFEELVKISMGLAA